MLDLLPLDTVAQGDIDRLVRVHGVSHLLVDPPFAAVPPHRYLLDTILADANSDATATAAMREGELVGLSIIRFPEWDSDLFGFPVGRVDHLIATDGTAMAALADDLVREVVVRKAGVTSARCSVEALAALDALAARGFVYRENILRPWRGLGDWVPRGMGATRPATQADVDDMCRIAKRAFRTDRFHRDPRFDDASADALYEKWVRTWHASPSPTRFSRVLESEGQVVGFFLYELDFPRGIDQDAVGLLTLDAVDPDFTGQGHGHAMYCDVLDDLRDRATFATSNVTGTNSAPLNLYSKLGFVLSSGGDATLHRWS